MQTQTTPPRVLGLYNEPFWALLKSEGRLHLQCCADCGTWRYPPGPVCQACLSPRAEWKPVGGGGELLSWVIFHRQYLPAYPAPHNVIAVRLDEGPTIISNLVDNPHGEGIIGSRVELTVVEMDDGVALPRFRRSV
ncbi:OB-fold domain-containing protein [Aquibium sp. LZ166]|uniref:OB-fold domain-containing protein n=1 Tax=Aquibium pacificus TaxID=3153579 RepID=A0ABV3SJ83_9HYPH